jgi:hypothetical protein
MAQTVDIQAFRDKLSKLKAERDEMLAERKYLLKRFKEEFNVRDLEGAKRYLEKAVKERDEIKAKIEDSATDLMDQLDM